MLINEFYLEGHDFVPAIKYHMYEANILDDVDISFIKDFCLKLETEMVSKYPSDEDGSTRLGKHSLTSRYKFYSLFTYKEMKPLANSIRKHYNSFLSKMNKENNHNIYCQSWANVLRKEEKMSRHNHWSMDYTYLSGHVCVSANDTCTNYYHPITGKQFKSKNEPGKLTIFPSWIFHDTDPVRDNEERITIAMDIYNQKGFDEDIYDDKKWRWVKL